MAKETRTFHIDGNDYSFNFSVFKRFFYSYKAKNCKTIAEAETKIAEALNLSTDTIHSWRFEKNGPSDTETIKQLSDYLGIKDYLILLDKKIGEHTMTANDRILDSLKRIYDAVIIYLDDFDTSFGFNMYWQELKDKGYDDAVIQNEIDGMASDKLHQVEIVLLQEYLILHRLNIYKKLEDYIYSDLCELWDGKTSYAYRFECTVENENGKKEPSAHEEYEIALNTINEMMSEYF